MVIKLRVQTRHIPVYTLDLLTVLVEVRGLGALGHLPTSLLVRTKNGNICLPLRDALCPLNDPYVSCVATSVAKVYRIRKKGYKRYISW